MPSYPNQNVIDYTDKEICDENNYYTKNNIAALQEAMMVLSGNAFKLWMYFAKNKPGHSLECSAVEIAKWGIPTASYHRAWNKLKELGYLEEISQYHYVFHEKSKMKTVKVDIDKESAFDF